VKTISATLDVARSNVIERRGSSRARRGPQERPGDVELAGAIRALVDTRPTPAFAGAGSMGTGGSPRY